MAYLLSKREGWDLKNIPFIEVGNFTGALKEFNENPDRVFLWERFMTKPYVDSGTLKKLGEIPTPWPSFCIVAKNEIIESNRDVLIEIMNIISTYTYKFKQNTLESIDYISNYFDFSIADMKEWIIGTDWNYYLDKPELKLAGVMEFLKEMNLVDSASSELDACPEAAFWNDVELYPPIP
jgi:sulfonate transport system substrate-binding protein